VLHEVGIDSDVACYDYTHIMGCPEWEDADFVGDVGDHFTPSWKQVRLRGFRRPDWFSQGPFSLCLGYLEARREGRMLRARALRRLMGTSRHLAAGPGSRRVGGFVRRTARACNHWLLHPVRRRHLLWRIKAFGCDGLGRSGRFVVLLLLRLSRLTRRRPTGPGRDPRIPDCHRRRQAARSLADRWLGRRTLDRLRPLRPVALPVLRTACIVGAGIAQGILFAGAFIGRVTQRGPEFVRRVARSAIGTVIFGLKRLGPLMPNPGADPLHQLPPAEDPVGDGFDFDARVAELLHAWREVFPDRSDPLTAADAEPYRHAIPRWRRLFRHFDVVEAYSTDPILTMLAGDVPYVAYEHGTIRDIPFADSATGRLTALAYRLADAVIITNPDCREAAERLGIERYRFVPHLIDRKYSDPAIAGGRLPDGIAGTYIFCPARHDFEVKGSHILIRAFAAFAADHPDVSLVMTRWGTDLDRSLALAEELGIRDRMVLAGPFHIHDLIRVTARARVLVDQFRFGVFGGIGPTALACGTPLITRLDHEKSAWCMERAPVWDARDEASCLQALRDVFAGDPVEQRRSLREWMERNYWHGDVATRHVELLLDAVDRHAVPSRSEAATVADAAGDVRHARDAGDTHAPAAPGLDAGLIAATPGAGPVAGRP
jgi:glycosyltransferase involved in cell wall biosynthesis